jgi:hypothetical protein
VNDPITIHHLDEASSEWIEDQASQHGVDKETIVLQLIHRGMLPTYHDLDSLAGTWSEADAEEFERATASFRQVDEELWR